MESRTNGAHEPIFKAEMKHGCREQTYHFISSRFTEVPWTLTYSSLCRWLSELANSDTVPSSAWGCPPILPGKSRQQPTVSQVTVTKCSHCSHWTFPLILCVQEAKPSPSFETAPGHFPHESFLSPAPLDTPAQHFIINALLAFYSTHVFIKLRFNVFIFAICCCYC